MGRDGALPVVLTLWRCQMAIETASVTCARVGSGRSRRSQGREDSNPRRAVLEAAVLAAELRPYVQLCPGN